MAKKDRVARRYVVWGRVQGVGYRAFAAHAANAAGVTGWARNLDNGSVEVYAIGKPEQLSFLEGQLRMGPRLADVRGMDTAEDTIDAGLRGFGVRG